MKNVDKIETMIPLPTTKGSYRKKYNKLGVIYNVEGSIELKMDPAIRKMAREITRITEVVKPLEDQASAIC
jgi:hypothetical protein